MVDQTVRNLVFYAKYLYMRGCEILDRQGTLAEGLSILNFHDAAELFLNALAIHTKAPIKDKENFATLIDKIEEAHGHSIFNRMCLIRINRARVNFKHVGLLPRLEDVKSFRQDLESLFYITSKSVLGLDYEKISLASLIKYHRVRMYLIDSESAISKNEIIESVTDSARAFSIVQSKMQSQIYKYNRESNIEQWVKDIYKELEEHRKLLLFNLFGIKLLEYNHFSRICPVAQMLANDEFQIIWKMNKNELTREDALFCFRFVLNIAMTLQDNAIQDSTDLEYVKRQNKLYKVTKESSIIVHPRRADSIRQARSGEILLAHFKRYDKKDYYAIVENGDMAFIDKNAVELHNDDR